MEVYCYCYFWFEYMCMLCVVGFYGLLYYCFGGGFFD